MNCEICSDGETVVQFRVSQTIFSFCGVSHFEEWYSRVFHPNRKKVEKRLQRPTTDKKEQEVNRRTNFLLRRRK